MGIRYDFTQHYNKVDQDGPLAVTKSVASVSNVEVVPLIGE